VNLGICLSMAGLDYSGVREPGFDAVRHAQRPQVAEYLARLCDTLPEVYFNPPTLEALAGEGGGSITKSDGSEWFVRHKDIYYDTDGITEAQTESLLLCGSCRGLMKVLSRSTKNPDCLGVEIPVDACPDCRQRG
jgi:hypothetical protein